MDALPIFLQPKLRLFLSVDLVGSTAAKQKPNFPISEPRRLFADGGMAPPWLSPIANFFGAFQEAFAREWRVFKNQNGAKLGISVATDPSFWKANGDELIFVKELRDRREVLGCIDAWAKALKSIRPQLIKSNLDVKATAWTAGFPVTNSELVFLTHPASDDVPFEDDSRLQQFDLLEKSYKVGSDKGEFVVDYIGPSIDTGFRLTSASTPRKFVVSVDVAYLLTTAQQPPETVIDLLPIFFSGNTVFKGVLGGKPYPVIWLDTMAGEKFHEAEDRLAGIKHATVEDIKSYCIQFYKENNTFMFLPFIFREHESQFGEFPVNYIEAMEHLCEKWQKERNRYIGETDIASIAGNGAEQLSESEAEAKTKEILALVEVRSSKK